MMAKRTPIAVLSAACLLLSPASGMAMEKEPGLVEMIASLQRLQDQVAQGVPGTREAQSDLVRHIDNALRGPAGRLPYSDKKRDAALTFMFIGGNARGLIALDWPEEVMAGEGEEAEEEEEAAAKVADPVLDFAKLVVAARGRIDPAALQTLAPKQLSRILKGPVALDQATALEDRKKMIEKLRIARTAGTGTLVEEAALRKLAALHLNAGAYDDYMSVVSRYMRAFARSPYAMGTYSGFAAFAASDAGLQRRDEVRDLLAFLPTDLGNTMRRSIQRRSVLNGNLALAGFYDMSEEPASSGQPNALVDAIIGLEERGERETIGKLRQIDEASLPSADRDLLRAAKRVFSEFESLDGAPDVAMPTADDTMSDGMMQPADADMPIDDSHFSAIEGDLKRLSERVDALGIGDIADGETP